MGEAAAQDEVSIIIYSLEIEISIAKEPVYSSIQPWKIFAAVAVTIVVAVAVVIVAKLQACSSWLVPKMDLISIYCSPSGIPEWNKLPIFASIFGSSYSYQSRVRSEDLGRLIHANTCAD